MSRRQQVIHTYGRHRQRVVTVEPWSSEDECRKNGGVFSSFSNNSSSSSNDSFQAAVFGHKQQKKTGGKSGKEKCLKGKKRAVNKENIEDELAPRSAQKKQSKRSRLLSPLSGGNSSTGSEGIFQSRERKSRRALLDKNTNIKDNEASPIVAAQKTTKTAAKKTCKKPRKFEVVHAKKVDSEKSKGITKIQEVPAGVNISLSSIASEKNPSALNFSQFDEYSLLVSSSPLREVAGDAQDSFVTPEVETNILPRNRMCASVSVNTSTPHHMKTPKENLGCKMKSSAIADSADPSPVAVSPQCCHQSLTSPEMQYDSLEENFKEAMMECSKKLEKLCVSCISSVAGSPVSELADISRMSTDVSANDSRNGRVYEPPVTRSALKKAGGLNHMFLSRGNVTESSFTSRASAMKQPFRNNYISRTPMLSEIDLEPYHDESSHFESVSLSKNHKDGQNFKTPGRLLDGENHHCEAGASSIECNSSGSEQNQVQPCRVALQKISDVCHVLRSGRKINVKLPRHVQASINYRQYGNCQQYSGLGSPNLVSRKDSSSVLKSGLSFDASQSLFDDLTDQEAEAVEALVSDENDNESVESDEELSDIVEEVDVSEDEECESTDEEYDRDEHGSGCDRQDFEVDREEEESNSEEEARVSEDEENEVVDSNSVLVDLPQTCSVNHYKDKDSTQQTKNKNNSCDQVQVALSCLPHIVLERLNNSLIHSGRRHRSKVEDSALEQLDNSFSSLKVLTPVKLARTGRVLSDQEKVLLQCDQDLPCSFEDCITSVMMETCVKIGEGVYGEVFRTERKKKSVALKIIPIEGDFLVNDEPQKTFGEILPEIVISKELSALRGTVNNFVENFVLVNGVWVIKGRYPDVLLEQWDIFHKNKRSENDRPDRFDDNQLFILFEFEDAGSDLEGFRFNNLAEAHSVLHQVVCALAVAETHLQFEHRDLHWGNVLVKRTDQPTTDYSLDGHKGQISTHGVKVAIIDFTLSRLSKDGCSVFTDLSTDETLFTGEGDYQFDIYRMMKDENRNSWEQHVPYTNVLWVHYLADKLIKFKRYTGNQYLSRQFRTFLREALDYRSAVHLLTSCPLFSQEL